MATFLRDAFAHHANERNATYLGSWCARNNGRRRQESVLASVILETGRALPSSAAPAGDERTLRGVPVIGVRPGAIVGTRPDVSVPTRLDRFNKRIYG